MCSHYESTSTQLELFDVQQLEGTKTDVWPGYVSTFIRRPKEADSGDEAVPARESVAGVFGMVPHWFKETEEKTWQQFIRYTYNARTETVAEKPTFRDAWKRGQHCIIPVDAIYEPYWSAGKSVPARITRRDGRPFGIAGLWTSNTHVQSEILRSFTMLTLNADDHPLMRHFHRPGDEKRMLAILPEAQYDEWLTAPAERSMDFIRQYPAELMVATIKGVVMDFK